MWGGIGNNSNGFDRDDTDHQRQLAAAAAQMAQLEAAQQQVNYSNGAPDFYNNLNVNAYQAAYQHRQEINHNAALIEERHRIEMALAASALQEQEAAQLRQAQIQAAYEREVASDMRRYSQELAGAVQHAPLNQDASIVNQQMSQMEFEERVRREMMTRSESMGSTSEIHNHDHDVPQHDPESDPDSSPGSLANTRTRTRTHAAMDSLAMLNNDSPPPSPIPEKHQEMLVDEPVEEKEEEPAPSEPEHEPEAEPEAEPEPEAVPDPEPEPEPEPEPPKEEIKVEDAPEPEPEPEPEPAPSPPVSQTKKKKKSTPSSSASKKGAKKTPTKRTPKKSAIPQLNIGSQPILSESVPDITEVEYLNLDLLMEQFCKVPLLAEFSRPVSLLHPELTPLYKKVVRNPIDLGKVCRAIRRRQYLNTRQVCVDVWRIFSNCVKYHTHPITREGAIPSFISIASHLREYFNALWLEYMVPSEIPKSEKEKSARMDALGHADEKRSKIRVERLNGISSVVLSSKLIDKASDAMMKFVEMEGKVDELDKDPIMAMSDDDDEDYDDESNAIAATFQALSGMASRLRDIAHSDYEYTVESLHNDLRRCYGEEVFEGFPWLKVKFEKRLQRLLGKLTVPINEVSCRGVNQSSVWGCMAAAIWARENTKKPYWPALVLGIMAPDDQKEDWHGYLTGRNEARLPEKLLSGLQTGKKKAHQAINRQNEGKAERMSYFLVEFLGTHEFIWVREADIIENFDPDEDVNQQLASVGNITKRKKSSLRGQTAANARMLQKATDEGRWALEEFDMLLNDPCGDEELADDDEEENYTFPVLCESDDEADEADGGVKKKGKSNAEVFESPTGVIADIDEINELIATDGKLDYSSEGRKNAKKRAAALKKRQAAEAKKSAQKKEKEKKIKAAKATKASKTSSKAAEKSKRQTDSESKKELKELEKRRKKRGRERERVLKESEKKAKKMRVGDGNGTMIRRGRKLEVANKRGRATNLVRGYLNRIAEKKGLRGLGLGGVSTLPAANVEGSGLLGLALAFRAAAGELEMPNSDDNPSSIKPWDVIDANGPLTSRERCKNLKQQIGLLEKALENLDGDDDRRKRLIERAKEDRIAYDQAIYSAEKDARQNDMPKRKVSVKRKTSVDKTEVKKEDDEEAAVSKKVKKEDDAADDDVGEKTNSSMLIDEDDDKSEDKKVEDVVKAEIVGEM